MKRQRDKKTARIFGIIALITLIAGCSSSGAQETLQSEEEPEGLTVVSSDLEDRTTAAFQETEEQKMEGLRMTGQDSTDGNSPERDADHAALTGTMEQKQPPEGFELVLDSEDWGLSFGEPGTQPVGNASPEDLAWYDAYFMGDDSEKVIYLTFDCGYENGNTEPILDALKKHHVTATFFVVGHFLETAPDLVKRMVEEGHIVGNHTYHHPDMSSISDLEAFQKELDDVAESFYEITGTTLPPYYRPPQGKANAANIRMAQELGYNTIFWSLAYVDWDTENQPSHVAAFEKLTSRIHPGAIVLLHNTSQTNGEILDELLTKWEDMGYRFLPLSELVSANQ